MYANQHFALFKILKKTGKTCFENMTPKTNKNGVSMACLGMACQGMPFLKAGGSGAPQRLAGAFFVPQKNVPFLKQCVRAPQRLAGAFFLKKLSFLNCARLRRSIVLIIVISWIY